MKKQITPANDDFNELLVDKQTDEVIQPGTPQYKEAFFELYGRYPGTPGTDAQPEQDFKDRLPDGIKLDCWDDDWGFSDTEQGINMLGIDLSENPDEHDFERAVAAEICKRYNQYPIAVNDAEKWSNRFAEQKSANYELEARNRELVEALRGLVSILPEDDNIWEDTQQARMIADAVEQANAALEASK